MPTTVLNSVNKTETLSRGFYFKLGRQPTNKCMEWIKSVSINSSYFALDHQRREFEPVTRVSQAEATTSATAFLQAAVETVKGNETIK